MFDNEKFDGVFAKLRFAAQETDHKYKVASGMRQFTLSQSFMCVEANGILFYAHKLIEINLLSNPQIVQSNENMAHKKLSPQSAEIFE